MTDNQVGAICAVIALAIVMGYIAFVNYLEHKERMRK